MLSNRNREAVENIVSLFEGSGYNVTINKVDANDYGVPQSRKRVFFVGFRNDLNINSFKFPNPNEFAHPSLKDAIYDLRDSAIIAKEKNKSNKDDCNVSNHEYFYGSYSSIYMSRNRVRGWNEPSFTIQASGRQAPQHPGVPKMIKVDKNKFIFDKSHKDEYRRLSVREAARIQTFPDDFIFIYDDINDGYKMVGNAVPVKLAKVLANQIASVLD